MLIQIGLVSIQDNLTLILDALRVDEQAVVLREIMRLFLDGLGAGMRRPESVAGVGVRVRFDLWLAAGGGRHSLRIAVEIILVLD